MTMFHLLKIKTSKGLFKSKKCKVTFGLEYIIHHKRGVEGHRHQGTEN